ncbi:NPCBM/NEW2 domain-containing protein [Nocardiopsis halophila]|uniref:NPCBM/NEW2 domain-containing protein n=1 Tax=Nocardiopsis halophila TaxID=141692 RepID=UPI00034DB24F|nr:NPCBM/NEW2 domain-containing protein [Nocardiopsis halophila]
MGGRGPSGRTPGPEHHHNENSGNAENVFQAGEIHGGIHFHGDPSSSAPGAAARSGGGPPGGKAEPGPEKRPGRRRRRLLFPLVLAAVAMAGVATALGTGLLPSPPYGAEGTGAPADQTTPDNGGGDSREQPDVEPGRSSPSVQAGPVEVAYLEDLPEEGDGVVVSDGIAYIAGDRYPKSIYYRLNAIADEQTFTYTVPQGFTSFKAVAGVSDKSRLGTTMEFEVRVDGAVVAESGDMAMQESHAFVVPVSAGSKLELVMRITTPDAGGGERDRYAMWGEARLEG